MDLRRFDGGCFSKCERDRPTGWLRGRGRTVDEEEEEKDEEEKDEEKDQEKKDEEIVAYKNNERNNSVK